MAAPPGEYQLRFSDPELDEYKEPPQYCLVELPPDVIDLVKQKDAK